ncbi:MAG TPA: type II toxin-antitoxin system HicB family antitoxin [Gemmataceae bacterium]|nr:type II toxin-antitoxin system HicB family antitoxin [Gemmataceae bacterium]
MLEYHATYYQVEDGWYAAEVLDFPGALSQGKTLKSARRMIRDALRCMIDWYMEDGQPFPRPNPRVKDKKAVFQETIRVSVRLEAGASP